MRVYIACLASYNAGILHGEWIDLDGLDADDLREEIADMLRRSPCPNVEVPCPECDGTGNANRDPHKADGCLRCGSTGKVPSAEEWAVHDYDDFPNLGEYPSIERLIEVAEAISKHGEAMRVWLDRTGSVEGFEDAYYGTAESWEDFVARLLEETGALDEVPEHLRYYFDYAAYARDLKTDGWWAEYGADGKMHFFSA